MVWDLRLHGEPGGPASIPGTARFVVAIFYIVTTPLSGRTSRNIPKTSAGLRVMVEATASLALGMAIGLVGLAAVATLWHLVC